MISSDLGFFQNLEQTNKQTNKQKIMVMKVEGYLTTNLPSSDHGLATQSPVFESRSLPGRVVVR